MLGLFNKKHPDGNTVTFKIEGMHCTSCSMNIDDLLEEADGVIKSETSYAKAKSVVTYDSKKISPEKIKKVIDSLDYTATEINPNARGKS